jgi:pheromone a factor receptor
VRILTSASWRTQSEFAITVEATRWLPVVCALLYLFFFGFSSEARKQYSLISCNVLAFFGLRRWRPDSRKAGLPRYVDKFASWSGLCSSLATFVVGRSH